MAVWPLPGSTGTQGLRGAVPGLRLTPGPASGRLPRRRPGTGGAWVGLEAAPPGPGSPPPRPPSPFPLPFRLSPLAQT